ncbi:MAG: pyridine nucleotide-disulfide oxidoreductase [Betaproteobacteria bacterium]|nr:pyridine nucleotide-disulfide oxidoreductase [Betaproteobacteria bacterium]
MSKGKLAVLVVVAGLIGAFFAFDLGRFLTLEFLKSQQAALEHFYTEHQVATLGIYFIAYVAIAALSLPGAALTTLVGGAIFGLVLGVAVVSFASSIGATLAFLTSRYLLQDAIQAKYGDRLKAINDGIAKDGAFYLFTIRMIPAIPFFVANLVMGITPIRTWTFYWVSQIGMFLGTIVFVNAGTELAKIESLSGILSPRIILAFLLLAFLGLFSKLVVDFIRHRQVYAKWRHLKPVTFDCNLIVIGAGSAGLVSSYIAAAAKSKVTLVERHKMGGDCLNTGCVPSKALIRSAKLLSHIGRSKELGVHTATATFNFSDVMDRVERVVKAIEPHDSPKRYSSLGVECLEGEARITSPWHVEIKTATGTRILTTRSIVVATGARPFIPPIPGIEAMGCLTSDNVWALRELPKRLVVLGGGPIGCELTQCFARLGSQVTQVEMLPRIMIREDPDISAMVLQCFRDEGINVLLNHKATRFVVEDGEKTLIAESAGKEVRIRFDALLCAVGRVANVKGFGLEELGIGVSKTRTVEVNEYLQTVYPNITACGDVAGPYQFTHTASFQAYFAASNALFGWLWRQKPSYAVIPWATFTDPEVARVGLNETEAKERDIHYEVTTYGIDDLDRAIADEEAHGVVKVLTVPGKDKILGVTIAGEHAGDLIAEFVLAMQHGLGLKKIMGTIHIYPTLAEANKFAAGVWRRNHAPAQILEWLRQLHAWRRGGKA